MLAHLAEEYALAINTGASLALLVQKSFGTSRASKLSEGARAILHQHWRISHHTMPSICFTYALLVLCLCFNYALLVPYYFPYALHCVNPGASLSPLTSALTLELSCLLCY